MKMLKKRLVLYEFCVRACSENAKTKSKAPPVGGPRRGGVTTPDSLANRAPDPVREAERTARRDLNALGLQSFARTAAAVQAGAIRFSFIRMDPRG